MRRGGESTVENEVGSEGLVRTKHPPLAVFIEKLGLAMERRRTGMALKDTFLPGLSFFAFVKS